MEDAGSGMRRAGGMRWVAGCGLGDARLRMLAPAVHKGTLRLGSPDAGARSSGPGTGTAGVWSGTGGLEQQPGPQRLHNPRRAPPCRNRGAPGQPRRQPAALGEAADAAGLLPSLSFFIFPPLPIPELPRAGHLPQLSRDAGAGDVRDAGMGIFSAAVGWERLTVAKILDQRGYPGGDEGGDARWAEGAGRRWVQSWECCETAPVFPEEPRGWSRILLMLHPFCL